MKFRFITALLALHCVFISSTSALGLHLDRDLETGAVHLCADDCKGIPTCAQDKGEACEYESVFEHLNESGVNSFEKVKKQTNSILLSVLIVQKIDLVKPQEYVVSSSVPYFSPLFSSFSFKDLLARAPPFN